MSPLLTKEPALSPAGASSSSTQTVARKAASSATCSHMPKDTGLRLAHYVHALDAGKLSSPTREAAVRCVLDLLCAAAAGFDHSSARAARAAVPFFGPGQADIWFAGSTASPLAALLANSVASSAHDLDDGYRKARGHPGASVIPAAWAILSESEPGVSAGDMLAAIVAGYEVGIRIALGRLSYAPSGSWSPYAVIAVAGKLSHASPEIMAQASASLHKQRRPFPESQECWVVM